VGGYLIYKLCNLTFIVASVAIDIIL